MSDFGGDRRRPDVVLHERLTRVEEAVNRIEPRLEELGRRSHDLMNAQQTLISKAEVAEEAHAETDRKLDSLAVIVSTAALTRVRTETELSSTLSSHISQYREDKTVTQAALQSQDRTRETMHAENQTKFARLERIVYLAIGGGVVIATGLGYALQIGLKVWR